MKILIIDQDNYQPVSKDKPQAGCYYYLEPYDEKSENQNKALHALIQEYWKSGLHPKYGGDDFASFRDKLKRDLGEGFESFVYADIVEGNPRIFQVKKYEEIPEHIRTSPELKNMVQGKLRSVSTYTKRMMQRFIDNIISDGFAAGMNSRKWQEIISGMEENSLKREKENLKNERR